MTAIKNYFKQQFQTTMFSLGHESPSDFYLSCFQSGSSPLPLLLIRGLLFAGCVSILLASIILTSTYGIGGFWVIYLTHWGLVFITVASGFGFLTSVKAYLQGSIDDTFGLPWYIKVYWVSYNIAIPLAVFITVFYWIFLSNANEEFAVSIVLDIFIHAINSVLMIILLLTGRHPTHVLHFYFVIVLSIIYIIFTVIYYFSGGTDPFGNVFIYPVLDWSNPGPTVIMLVISLIMAVVVHFILALLAVARNAIFERCRENNTFSPTY